MKDTRKTKAELIKELEALRARLADVEGSAPAHSRAERALRHTDDMLEKVFSSIHALLAYMDRDFNFIRVNRAYAEADGKTPDFYPGRNHFDFYPNEENEAIFRRVVETGEPQTFFAKPFEYAQNPERGVTYWDWTLLPVKDSAGEVEGVLLWLVDVTGRERALDALRLSEERYRLHFEHVGDVIYTTGTDLRIINVSPSVEPLLGYRRDEIIGRRIDELELLSPEYLELAVRNTSRALSGQKTGPTEYEFIAKDGTKKIGEISAAPLMKDGRVTAIISVARDITKRKQAERELRKYRERLEEIVERRAQELEAALEEVEVNEEELRQQNEELAAARAAADAERRRYQDLFESAPDGYLVTDTSGAILEANRSAVEMLKTLCQEMIGQPLNLCLAGQDSREYFHQLAQLKCGREVRNWEITFRPPGGGQFFASVNAVVVEGQDGSPATYRWMLRDVTKQKHAERALVEANDNLSGILRSISDGFFTLDNNLVVTYFNRAAERLLGRTAEEVVGRPLFEAFPEAKGSIFEERYTRAVKEKVTLGFETYFGVAPYENWYEVRVFPYREGISVYFRVTTERKQAEEKLLREAEVDAALAELSRALLQSPSIDYISSLVLECAKSLTGSKFGYVGHIDERTGYLVSPTLTRDVWEVCQVPDKNIVFEKFAGLWGWVLENRKSLLTNSPSADSRSTGTPPGHIPVERFLSAPAVVADMLVGQVALINPDRDYDERDLAVVERLAALYALAVQRSRIERGQQEALAESRKRERETAALLASSRAVLEHQKFSDAAEAIFNSCKNSIGATAGYVSLLSEDGTQNDAVFIDSGGTPCNVDPDMPMLVRGMRAEAYRSGKPVYDNSFSESQWKELLPPGHAPMENVLFAPLRVGESAIGLIGLANKPGGFTDEDARLASAFADHAAIAFRNSRYLAAVEESERRYRRLSESLEETVRKKVEELKQIESLAAVGQMVSVVAHEVRNPLQNIRMGIEEIRRKNRDEKENTAILQEMAYGVNLLEATITELLEYSKPARLNRFMLPLGEVVGQAIRMLDDRMGNVSVHTDLEREEREISVDPEKLLRVLVNLMGNSLDAMPDGGELRVESRFVETGGANVLKLCVSDTGSGMEQKTLQKIWEPFFTTKTRGTGLGAPICKRLVEAHGGCVNITSKPNEGTCVEITLPV